jgi:hypothetical protein
MTKPWQFAVFMMASLIHVCLISVGIWNAAKKYIGLRIWPYLAKATVILNVVQWLLIAPDYFVSLLNAAGMDLRSGKYWEIHGNPLVCEPALLQFTPENILKKYPGECSAQAGDSGRAIIIDCEMSSLKSKFVYFLNQNDCTNFRQKFNSTKHPN